jgi:hypothetical protein
MAQVVEGQRLEVSISTPKIKGGDNNARDVLKSKT